MKVVVLLSAGRHPVSGRPAPVPVEMQAIRMAADLGVPPDGLHVGDEDTGVVDALGHGLGRLVILQAGDPATIDPLPALRASVLAGRPDVILAGRRGRGGTDSGLLPYRLAQALGWPIIADIVSLTRVGNTIQAAQARPRGDRRVLELPTPFVATVHPAAPPAYPFRHAGTRGDLVRQASETLPESAVGDLRPYRARPQIIERHETSGRALQGLSAEQAAAEILAELRRLNLVKT